jgi:poly(hydroxyalkanoate) depolymerase family esterase
MTRMLRPLLCSVVVGLGTAAQTPAPAQAAALPGTYVSGTYTSSEGARQYLAYVPSTYSPDRPAPLLVALHGCLETADSFRRLTRLDEVAQADGFVVVFPQQSVLANPSACWNWFLPGDLHRGSGEPSIIAGITGLVQQRYRIDPGRIFVTGASAGGAMSAIMGATYPDLYAAVGVGSGCEYDGAPCSALGGTDPTIAGTAAFREMGPRARELPVLVFQGDSDVVVAPINAAQDVRQWQVTADWADDGSLNGSVPRTPASTVDGQVPGGESYTVRRHVDGAGAELEQYWLVHGMGHAWGGGCACETFADPAAPDESRVMYAFFFDHPRR